jgi:prevent-host-death family protein
MVADLGGMTARVNRDIYTSVLQHLQHCCICCKCWKMRYSTSDLSRKSGDIIARALQGPVTITQRGKPRLIMMSVEEYNRLRDKKEVKLAQNPTIQG